MAYPVINRAMGAIFAAALLVMVVGCDGDATVRGKVSSKGVPLNSGIVSFHKDQTRRDASIASDGTYQILEMEPGEYRVTVEVKNRKVAPPPRWAKPPVVIPGQPKVAGQSSLNPVPVDPKYRDVNSSGLKYEVGSGSETINIDLK